MERDNNLNGPVEVITKSYETALQSASILSHTNLLISGSASCYQYNVETSKACYWDEEKSCYTHNAHTERKRVKGHNCTETQKSYTMPSSIFIS